MKTAQKIAVHNRPEMRVLEDVVTLKNLKPRIERFHDVEEGLAHERAIQNEITNLGKYTGANGFTQGRSMQRVAAIPPSVWSAVVEVFPDAGENKDLFYALLAGPLKEYDMRNKIVLT